MKIKFKPGNRDNKFPPSPSNIISYYMNINKAFTKNLGMDKSNSTNSSENSDTMPAYAHDFGNYVARFGMGTFQIQVIMKLDGRLDYDKLRRAVRLSIDAEPVLGCRFVEHNPPYFKRRDDLDEIAFCTLEETYNMEEAVQRFIEAPIDMDLDPMVKLKLIRSNEYDTLCLKLNHTCSDGSGTKDYINLLSRIYTCIDKEDGNYVPTPCVRSREDHEKVFKTLGIKHPELDTSIVDAPRTVWPFPWQSGGSNDIVNFVVCKVPDGQLNVMSKYAKERGTTINNLILTAFYRAMFKMVKPPYGIPMDMGLTIDLRRYLPDNKASSIRNLSGGVITRVARLKNEPFEGTLSRVTAVMDRKKDKNPGYQGATGAERAELLNFHQFVALSKFLSKVSEITSQNSFFCSPGLSNVGLISKELIKFGETAITEAYFVPPVIHAPGLLLVASSYNGILTFAVGYYKGSINKSYLESLLNNIRDELIDGCK